ncbi:MAG: GpE family phage tail protein [Pseudomonadota bacterium]
MADIAVIFHWPPSEMDGMNLEELAGWHARALARHEAQEGRPK